MPCRKAGYCAILFATMLVQGRVAAGSGVAVGAAGGEFEMELRWSWSDFGRVGPAGELEAIDLDRDGGLEVVTTAGSHWYVADYDGAVVQHLSSIPFGSVLSLVAIELVDRTEIAVLTSSSIDIFDGASGELIRRLPTPGGTALGAYGDDIGAADLEGDGTIELVLCSWSDLFVVDSVSGDLEATLLGFGCADLDIGQADGDAALEIGLAGNPFGGFLLDGASLTVQFADLDGFGSRLRFFDSDDDQISEILAVGPAPGSLRALRSSDGGLLWSSDLPSDAIATLGDLDGDGDREILVGDPNSLRVIDEETGEDLWFIPSLLSDADSVGLAAGDLDGDGTTEILWALTGDPPSGPALTEWIAVDAVTRSEEYRLHSPHLNQDLEACDLDGDGRVELLGTYSTNASPNRGGLPVTFDPLLRQVRSLGSGLAPQLVAFAGDSTAAQLDTDPQLEVCTSFRDSTTSVVRCEDSVSLVEQWRAPFPLAEAAGSVQALEIDGGGVQEIVVGTSSQHIYALEGEDGALKWRSPELTFGPPRVTYISLADVLGDAEPEILAIIGGFGDVVTLDPLSGVALSGPVETFATVLATTQLDADPQLEVLAGVDYGSIVHLDIVSGQYLETIATVQPSIRSIVIGDLTRDEVEDLAVLAEGRIHVFDGLSDVLLWQSERVAPDGSGGLRLADVDHDSLPDLLVPASGSFTIVETPASLFFLGDFETGDSSAWSSTHP